LGCRNNQGRNVRLGGYPALHRLFPCQYRVCAERPQPGPAIPRSGLLFCRGWENQHLNHRGHGGAQRSTGDSGRRSCLARANLPLPACAVAGPDSSRWSSR